MFPPTRSIRGLNGNRAHASSCEWRGVARVSTLRERLVPARRRRLLFSFSRFPFAEKKKNEKPLVRLVFSPISPCPSPISSGSHKFCSKLALINHALPLTPCSLLLLPTRARVLLLPRHNCLCVWPSTSRGDSASEFSFSLLKSSPRVLLRRRRRRTRGKEGEGRRSVEAQRGKEWVIYHL